MTNDKQSKMTGMDPHVLIDALAVIMGHEEKELCKPGHLALVLIKDTADTILGSQERVSYVVISKVKGLSRGHSYVAVVYFLAFIVIAFQLLHAKEM